VLSNPGSDPEVSLGSSCHRTLLGRQSDKLGTLEQGERHRFLPHCHFLPATLLFPATALFSLRDAALHQSQGVAVVLPIYGLGV